MGTPAYNIAKFLVPKLSSVGTNEFTVRYSLHFSEGIWEQANSL